MITVGIASVPEREHLLKKTIDSLKGQADVIYVALNNYLTVPSYFERYSNVKYLMFEDNLGDAMKFYWADQVEGYCFFCDDDLIYPPLYCETLIKAIDKHKCIVSLHGKVFRNRPVLSYRRGFTENVHCLLPCDVSKFVDVGGTGVMAFHTDHFKVSIDDFDTPNMGDIYLARKAHASGVKILALAHEGGWLGYQNPEKTIWNTFSRDNDAFQTSVLNSFLK